MQVTLKKASEFSRALAAAAKAVEVKPTLSISAYSETDVEETVIKGRETFFNSLARASFLITSAFELRAMIGSANDKEGISEMLTEVAAIDDILKVFSTHIDSVDIFAGTLADSDDISSLKKRVVQARNDISNAEQRRYGQTENVGVALLGVAEKAKLVENVASLKRQRTALKDKITGANFNTTITLSENVILALKNEKLIEA